MTTNATLSRSQLRQLERALRSSRARLERSMVADRLRRIASRSRKGTGERHAGRATAGVHDERTLTQHRELVDAVRRLESGSYGTCEHCGSAIDFDRLTAHPHTTHCAECAARLAGAGAE